MWTLLSDPSEVKDALEKRAKERSKEETRSGAFFNKLVEATESESRKPVKGPPETGATHEPASPVTPTKGNADQSQEEGKPTEPSKGSGPCCAVA